jgi:starch phosphorylase
MLSPDHARIRSFEVVPALPRALEPLQEIAHNLWWTWHPEAVDLFIRLDRQLWQDTNHNPVKMLGMISQAALDAAARDEGFLNSLDRVVYNLQRHMDRTPWLTTVNRDPNAGGGNARIAYFCAEFGLTECLQVYSGGLGILAGDHLKSASELGLPFLAVGLLYRHGYFQQYLNADGWQQEYTPDLDFENLPIRRVTDAKGEQVKVSVEMPGRTVHIAVWKVMVGRVPLYLLDTNLTENDPNDRGITGQLYGGDMEMRIKQEIVLGIGGTRALKAIGIEPEVCHMNEGHSAFLALERIRNIIATHNLSFDEARQQASASHVFTTHTPVPAGIDRFPPDMIQRYFKHYVEGLRLDMEGLLALGRENVFNKNEFFSMAVLAIRTSDWANGVSKLHGKISRQMWNGIWPHVPENEVPIIHVTNGVHARSWLSGELIYLLDRYLGNRWQANPVDHDVWKAIYEVPDEELWRVHERRRQRLIVWARRQLKKQLARRGTNPDVIRQRCDALNPSALTVGFARRFATYKRGTLFMRDAHRLLQLLRNVDRPVQFMIAGKAHPADGGGKDLIRQIVKFARESEAGAHIVFLENYDIHVARYLVQGCDVWLNNPRRGMEASGTSGMKAAMNGVLNCSIEDGWWDEAAGEIAGEIGWSIGRGEEYPNPETADQLESQALYDLLEREIVPLFYNRDDQGVPRKWVAMMKDSIAKLAPTFNTNRMLQEYSDKLYLPALKRAKVLAEDGAKKAVELAHQKERLRHAWPSLRIEDVSANTDQPLGVRDTLNLGVEVLLGSIKPDEVRVQVYSGKLDNDGRLVHTHTADLVHREDLGGGRHRFVGSIQTETSGRHGFAVRIVPGGVMFEGIQEPGLMLWEHAPGRQEPDKPVPVPTPAMAH